MKRTILVLAFLFKTFTGLFCNDGVTSFDTFFKIFNKDRQFQKEHIVFPLLCISSNVEFFDGVYIDESDWDFLSFDLDVFLMRIKYITQKTTECYFEIPDTDTGYKLVFRVLEGDWKLTDYMDLST